MDLPDPFGAFKFEMERKGLTVKDLEPMIGDDLAPNIKCQPETAVLCNVLLPVNDEESCPVLYLIPNNFRL